MLMKKLSEVLEFVDPFPSPFHTLAYHEVLQTGIRNMHGCTP